ncbi:MAG: AtpZ/AtpI family protein [Terriglobia bacterium]
MDVTGGQKSSDIWAQVAYYTSLGFVLPAGVAVGYAGGWLLDRWLRTAPIFGVILTFLGAAGGFIEVLVILKRAEKRDERDESGGTGPGPS